MCSFWLQGKIFADTFSHEGKGLKSGERVDSVAYWSAVIMAFVRLGMNHPNEKKGKNL